jgi:hypothetical protein
MFNKALVTICFPILSVSYAQAQETRQQLVNDAIKSAEAVCLVGTKYRFSVDANARLTISKLLPGAEAKATVDNINSKGSQFFDNEEIRRIVDQDIRLCMQGEWPKVLNAFGVDQHDKPLCPSIGGTWYHSDLRIVVQIRQDGCKISGEYKVPFSPAAGLFSYNELTGRADAEGDKFEVTVNSTNPYGCTVVFYGRLTAIEQQQLTSHIYRSSGQCGFVQDYTETLTWVRR